MYRMSEVATKLGISRQAVYKRVASLKLDKYIVVEDKIKHLTEEGLQILLETTIKEKDIIDEDDVKDKVILDRDHNLVKILNDVISSKEKEVDYLRSKNRNYRSF